MIDTKAMTDKTCKEFTEALASKSPTPGGGGAAAYVGTLGIALGNMVGNLTLGKKRYANVQDDITQLMRQATVLQNELLVLVEKDAEVFEPLSRAYSLPKNTDEEKAEKARIMEAALHAAAAVPLEIMRKCCDAINLHEVFAQKGAVIAISDVGCGVACCKAALMAASLNVFINTKAMASPGALNAQANALLDEYTAKADKIYAQVLERLI